MTRKVMWAGSSQFTRPTSTVPLSWASVRTPPPKVETPANCWVWPFCVTCQLYAPPGWIVRTIEVSGPDCAFQVPRSSRLRAAWCWPGPEPGAEKRPRARLALLSGFELLEQLRRDGIAGLQRNHLLEDPGGVLEIAFRDVVVSKHEPARGRLRVRLAVASSARSWVV